MQHDFASSLAFVQRPWGIIHRLDVSFLAKPSNFVMHFEEKTLINCPAKPSFDIHKRELAEENGEIRMPARQQRFIDREN